MRRFEMTLIAIILKLMFLMMFFNWGPPVKSIVAAIENGLFAFEPDDSDNEERTNKENTEDDHPGTD